MCAQSVCAVLGVFTGERCLLHALATKVLVLLAEDAKLVCRHAPITLAAVTAATVRRWVGVWRLHVFAVAAVGATADLLLLLPQRILSLLQGGLSLLQCILPLFHSGLSLCEGLLARTRCTAVLHASALQSLKPARADWVPRVTRVLPVDTLALRPLVDGEILAAQREC